MKTKATLVFIAIATILSCCKCNIDKPGSQKQCGELNIALCDLTHSLDSTSIDSIANHAAFLLFNSRANRDWYFYGIGESDYNEAIYQYKYREPDLSTPLSDSIAAAELRARVNDVRNSILNQYEKKKYQRTCVTYAFKTAYQKILERREQDPSLRCNVFIFSDLLEDCNHVQLGKLDFTNVARSKITLASLDTTKPVSTNLKAQGVHLYLVAESRNKQTDMKLGDLENNWRVLLQKFGYDKNDALVKFYWLSLPEEFVK